MRQHCVISHVRRVSAHSWFLGQKGDRGHAGGQAGGLTRCQGKSDPRFDYSRAFPPLHLHWTHPSGQLAFWRPPPLRATGARLYKRRCRGTVCPGGAAAAAAVETLSSGFCDQPKSTMEKGTTEWKWSHAAIMTPKFGLFCRPDYLFQSQFILCCQIMCTFYITCFLPSGVMNWEEFCVHCCCF